jgi:septal ring factor EnvC (AmiA/AmiB activator)
MNTALAIITALLLSFINQSRADNPDRQEQIEEFQERLDIKRTQYEELAGREKDQIEKLRSIEEQIALSNQLLLKIRRESERLRKSIARHGVDLENSNKSYEIKKKALYARMKYIYKHGGRPAWLSLLSSGNPTEALVAFKNITSIMKYDRQLLSSIESISRNIKQELSAMKNEQQLLQNFENEYGEEQELRKASLDVRKERKASLDVRKELLENIRSDKSEIAGAISTLEQDMEAVAEIFADLDESVVDLTDSLPLTGLKDQRGNLIWPINPGIDIKGTTGGKIVAAATGKAIYISWLRGYGQFIILDHGGSYYTLYANLSDIFVETGDMVKAGEVIAEVGELGSLEGPGLHFELRHEKESLDPTRWLR